MTEELARAVAYEMAAQIEELFMLRVQAIEGRTPDHEELAEHGHEIIRSDNVREWTWKGEVILRCELEFRGEILIIKVS